MVQSEAADEVGGFGGGEFVTVLEEWDECGSGGGNGRRCCGLGQLTVLVAIQEVIVKGVLDVGGLFQHYRTQVLFRKCDNEVLALSELVEQEILLMGEVELDWSVVGGCLAVCFAVTLRKGHCLKIIHAGLVWWWLPSRRYVEFWNEAWHGDNVVLKPCFEVG